MRTPGVEPGSQDWGACMMPLHYVRSRGDFRRLAIGVDAHVVSNRAARTRKGRRVAPLFTAAVATTQKRRGTTVSLCPGARGRTRATTAPNSRANRGRPFGHCPRLVRAAFAAGPAHWRAGRHRAGGPTPNRDTKAVQKTPFDCTSVTCAFSSGDDFLQTSLMQ